MARICKVLVVENDGGIRNFLGHLFRDEGYLFSMVGTGAEMGAALDDDDCDVVVIDVTQPGRGDGFVLARIAREQGCGAILVTGDHRLGDRLQASGERYLLKPFRVQQMVDAIEAVLADTAARCVRRKRGDGSPFPLRGA